MPQAPPVPKPLSLGPPTHGHAKSNFLSVSFKDIQRPIRDALAKYEPLVLRKTIHTPQQPLGHVVPLDQQNRRFVTSGRPRHIYRHFSNFKNRPSPRSGKG